MRFWIFTSSVLAILGGALFLVLPVAFLSRIISIAYPPVSPIVCGSYNCLVPLYHYTSPGDMVPFWASLGFVGVLLGFLIMVLGERPRVGFALGLTFSLGSIALVFWTVTSQILRTFMVTPADFLLLPEASVVAMTAATLFYTYEFLRRGREIIDAITS